MTPAFVVAPPLAAGDRVALLSPSWAAPAVFPAVHELAMQRLRSDFGLVPVEFPTTRVLDASPADRARDVTAAFADPSIRALFATVGGDDQITVLPHLDADVVRAHPKPFFGYSDNTNLLNWLWNLGIVSYHGGSTQVHVGRGGGMHPTSAASLRAALFTRGDVRIEPQPTFAEDDIDWGDPAALTRAAGRWIQPVDNYAGCVLLIETSEEMPSGEDVFRMLRNTGERGLLAQFPAVVVGRPKAASRQRPTSAEERVGYRREQKAAIVSAFATYQPEAMIVFDVDFGHTDPQYVLPYGGEVTVDGPDRRLIAHY